MIVSRRKALRFFGGAASAAALRTGFAAGLPSAVPKPLPVTPGKFTGTRASLRAYSLPDWFGDAKFGIWSHWGPQSAVGDGDWYARNMYREDTEQYNYHVKRFGPQSKIGYKDLIPLFTADKWDPEHLMNLYAAAGAKYFFSMGVHHDNYDMWDSKYQPRWNAATSGPHKDVVGLWAAAARRRGLRFGVSEHLSNSFDWFSPSHLSDTKGPLAGVPYDGTDPAFADLYHDYSGLPADWPKRFSAISHQGMSREAPDRWKMQYFRRVKDLVDQHQPDLLYTDGGIPFEEYGLSTVAELYNVGPLDPRGMAEPVYFSKSMTDCEKGTCALDRERQVGESILPAPWQTDTCIGVWHYKVGATYKTPKKVIDLLVDIVSKNGNLLLNFPLPASGELDPEEMRTLEGITNWMAVNGEGIFATRPWTVYGEGPAIGAVAPSPVVGFNEDKKPGLTAQDIRYTTKGKTMYAFAQGWPAGDLNLKQLGTSSPQKPGQVRDVRLLGRDQKLPFTQSADGLSVRLPQEKPATADIGIAVKLEFV